MLEPGLRWDALEPCGLLVSQQLTVHDGELGPGQGDFEASLLGKPVLCRTQDDRVVGDAQPGMARRRRSGPFPEDSLARPGLLMVVLIGC